MQKVVILDYKNNILENPETFSRHKMYAALLFKNKNYELMSINKGKIRDPSVQKKNHQFLKIITINKIFYIFYACNFIKQKSNHVKTVIFSDPWFLTAFTLTIFRILRHKVRVQVQVHADIGVTNWRTQSVKNYLRFYAAKISLNAADSIRLVSTAQKKDILKKFNLNSAKCVVAPVPITWNIKQNSANVVKKSTKVMNIGYIGRIHKERNLDEIYEFVKKLPSDTKYVFHLAGYGKQLNSFIEKLSNLQNLSVKHYGFLSKKDFPKYFSRLDFFLNLTNFESYGRSMRESLIYKTPVLAFNSSGSRDLKKITSENDLYILKNSYKQVDLVKYFALIRKLTIKENYFELFSRIDQNSMRVLIESWL